MNFAGMVEAVGGGVGAGGGVGGVPWLQPYELATLQCCKYSDNQSVFLHLFCCGLLLGCRGVFVLLAGCTVPGMVEAVRWWCGVVVVVVVWCWWWWRLAGRYPSLHLYSWNDKVVWNAEIFF